MPKVDGVALEIHCENLKKRLQVASEQLHEFRQLFDSEMAELKRELLRCREIRQTRRAEAKEEQHRLEEARQTQLEADRQRRLEEAQQRQCDEDRKLAEAMAAEVFHCDLCDDDFPNDDLFVLQNCDFKMCRNCARGHLMTQIKDQHFPLTCAHCEAEVMPDEAELVLDEQQIELMRRLALERATADCVQCPRPNCPGKADVVKPNRLFICPQCFHQMCSVCRDDWHAGTCEEYAEQKKHAEKDRLRYNEWKQDNDNADRLFDDFRRQHQIQVCPNCRYGVERTQGCNHMTCRCGTEFCYVCGQLWRGYGVCH